jgi:GNAT superfamily N-acetyltransferase
MPPTPTTTDPRLTRALAFERAMHAAGGRVVTAPWGQAFLEPAIGRCYERNQARTWPDAGGLDAAALDAQVARLFADAGLGHRQIGVEPPAHARLGDGLTALGYAAARHLFLAFDGAAPPAPRAAVEEIDLVTALAAQERYLTTDPDTPYGRDDETRAHLLEHHRTFGQPVGERRFAVVRDREAVAWAKLWSDGAVAQVEDVVCLAEHRGHGYGRDVVAAATRAALAASPELLFIVADDDDWPKDLYGRLGYRPIGTLGVFTRHEPGHPWAVR